MNQMIREARISIGQFIDACGKAGITKKKLNDAYGEWLLNRDSVSNSRSGLTSAQAKRDLGAISIDRHKADSNFSMEFLSTVRLFLNELYGAFGQLTEDWKFKGKDQSGDDIIIKAFYVLYYPKGESVIRCFVETEVRNNTWTSFRFRIFREEFKNGSMELISRTSYSTRELSRHPDDIIRTNNIIYLSVKLDNSSGGEELYHRYTFSISGKYFYDQSYIFGTFSRIKKDSLVPSAGVCLLKRINVADAGEAEKICKEPVPPEVYSSLYKRRLELTAFESIHNLSSLPDEQVVKSLSQYTGMWEGRHLDSELNNRIGYIRTFRLFIDASGKARLEYSDDDEPDRSEKSITGFIYLLEAERLFVEFVERRMDERRPIPRIIICLMRQDSQILSGSYGGFSAGKNKPYAGAIILKRTDGKPPIQNIRKLDQNQSHEELLRGLGQAYNQFVNLPEKSLKEPLLVNFGNSNQTANPAQGFFRAFSFSSDKNAIVAYPLNFGDGYCTMEKSPETYHSSTYLAKIQQVDDYLSLHFNDDAQTVLMMYRGGGSFNKIQITPAITLRVNKSGLLQARREILIKDLVPHPWAQYTIGSEELDRLLEQKPYHVLRSLIGREFSLMQLPIPRGKADLDTIGKRQDFMGMYLSYSLSQHLSGFDWRSALEQSLLHGGAILKKDAYLTLFKTHLNLFDPKKYDNAKIIDEYTREIDKILSTLDIND